MSALPPLPRDPLALAALVTERDKRAIARAISWIENGEAGAEPLLERLGASLHGTVRTGLTGPPGAGKSTLTASLAETLRGRGASVGIVAVDPTSPFTGGALLGDRIRMGAVSGHKDVYIRSMASRGALGGIAHATLDALDVLDAAGFGAILVETVGVGQSEVEIASAADTTVIVLSPESGDTVQTMKAGLMEVGDVFVVNKADREGADKLVRSIHAMLELSPNDHGHLPPVLKTDARTGDGVPALADALAEREARLRESGALRERRLRRAASRLRGLLTARLLRLFDAAAGPLDLAAESAPIAEGTSTPHQVAEALMERFVHAVRSPHEMGAASA